MESIRLHLKEFINEVVALIEFLFKKVFIEQLLLQFKLIVFGNGFLKIGFGIFKKNAFCSALDKDYRLSHTSQAKT
jgi:hypothetical protein